MRYVTLAAMLTSLPALAHETPTDDQMAKVEAALASIGCIADPADVVEHETHFEMIGAICDDGHYFIELNAAFEVVKKLKQ